LAVGYAQASDFQLDNVKLLQATKLQTTGKVLAESSVFIAVAHVLATFTISKVVEDGVVIEPSVAQTSGTIR